MENSYFKTNLKIVLSSLCVAVVLLLVIFQGLNKGKQAAQAQIIAQGAQNLAAGLKYFYNDQNRFPSATEFADQNIMLNYFSAFPPTNFVSAACSQSFIYKRISQTNFQLNFCLPRGVGGYNDGWNMINGQPNSESK